jgi:hypothetical protein
MNQSVTVNKTGLTDDDRQESIQFKRILLANSLKQNTVLYTRHDYDYCTTTVHVVIV